MKKILGLILRLLPVARRFLSFFSLFTVRILSLYGAIFVFYACMVARNGGYSSTIHGSDLISFARVLSGPAVAVTLAYLLFLDSSTGASALRFLPLPPRFLSFVSRFLIDFFALFGAIFVFGVFTIAKTGAYTSTINEAEMVSSVLGLSVSLATIVLIKSVIFDSAYGVLRDRLSRWMERNEDMVWRWLKRA